MLTTDSQGYQNLFTYSCDECGEQSEIVAEDLKEATAILKESGWRIVRDDEVKEWYHYCKECKVI